MMVLLVRVYLVGIFSFSTLNISCHSLLACRVSAEKSPDCLMRVPLYLTSCFSLFPFKILSLHAQKVACLTKRNKQKNPNKKKILSLIFTILITIFSWCGPLWFNLVWRLFVLPGTGYSPVQGHSHQLFLQISSASLSLFLLRLL